MLFKVLTLYFRNVFLFQKIDHLFWTSSCNLIGEHTDYNDGFVLPAAIDKAMYFAMAKSKGAAGFHVQAANYEELIHIHENADQLPSWARYFKAITQNTIRSAIFYWTLQPF